MQKINKKVDLPLIMLLLALLLIAYVIYTDKTAVKKTYVENGCVIGGCNKDLCGDVGDPKDNLISTCEVKPGTFCNKKYSTCEKQQNKQCGWTNNANLQKCLSENRINTLETKEDVLSFINNKLSKDTESKKSIFSGICEKPNKISVSQHELGWRIFCENTDFIKKALEVVIDKKGEIVGEPKFLIAK